jgi:hypothetical protein
MTGTIMTTTTSDTTIDTAVVNRISTFALGSITVAVLLTAPLQFADAAEDHQSAAPESTHEGLGATIKRDSKKTGAAIKEGAHRVAVASKAVGHEVATAAKRGAAATRAAFRGQKPDTPAN